MLITRLLAAVVLMACAGVASAQFPSKTVAITVPFTPGGSNDLFARAIAQDLSKVWNVAVIVENRPGGGGTIGANYVAKSAPDGHTLMLVSTTFAINSVLQAQLPFDPIKSFTPIALVGKGPMLAVAAPGFKAKNLAEMLALARARPGGVTYASAGAGGMNHMATELLASIAGVKLTHVPYKGGAQALNDLLGNHVDIYVGSVTQVLSQVRAGKVTALGVTSPQRDKVIPDVPAIAESLPNYVVELWWGIFGPANLPAPVVATLNREINKVLETPKMRQFLEGEAATPAPMPSAQFASMLASEIQRWGKVAKEANIKAE